MATKAQDKPLKVVANDGPDPKLAIWEALSKTDPAQTKQFSRAGGFKGTAIKPMWVIKRLTEQFGPCGVGWGIGEPRFEVVHGAPGETLVYCTVSCWHGKPDNVLYGVGGDRVAVMRANGNPFFDDEAFKKAFTDAVNNAFKFIGVAADIHMGLFDDSKYVDETRKEFDESKREKVPGIHKIKERLRTLTDDGNKAEKLEDFNALVSQHKSDLQTIKDANHEWWTGDGEDFEGFKAYIKRRREELAPRQESAAFQLITSLVAEAETTEDLRSLLEEHDDTIAKLDGDESRRFDLAFNNREADLAITKQPTPLTEGAFGG
jgi:hypothetical protein